MKLTPGLASEPQSSSQPALELPLEQPPLPLSSSQTSSYQSPPWPGPPRLHRLPSSCPLPLSSTSSWS